MRPARAKAAPVRAWPRLALAALLLLVPAGPLAAEDACPALPPRAAPPPDAQPAFLDVPYWRERVAELDRVLGTVRLSDVRLLFLGDSITEAWFPAVAAFPASPEWEAAPRVFFARSA